MKVTSVVRNKKVNIENISKALLSVDCGEQVLPIGGVCLLGSINLTQFIKENNWDYDKLGEAVPNIVRFMDNVNDITYVPLPSQKENLKNKRRIGLGIMGYGSALLMMKTAYGSKKALKLTEELMSFISNKAYETSALLSKEKGSFILFDKEKYLESKYIKKLSEETKKLISENGIRNSHLLSIQPTGNTSIFSNCISGGLEPIFLFEYIRTTIVPSPPEGLKIPKNIDWENKKTDCDEKCEWNWIKEGDESLLKCSFDNITYKIDRNRGLLKETLIEDYGVKYLKGIGEWDENAEWAKNTNNLTVDDHVETMKVFSKYIDSALSKTLNLPNDYPYEDFKNIYLKLYDTKTIKGGTTYRSGTMSTVLSEVNKDDKNKPCKEFEEKNAPKRPKILNASVVRFTNDKEKWIGFIGLLDNRPYEIFTGKLENFPLPISVKEGQIKKMKIINEKGEKVSKYNFIFKDKNGEDVMLEGLNKSFNPEYWNYAKMISGILRHGMPLSYVVELINDLDLKQDLLNTWKNGVQRMIKNYIKDGTIVKDKACSNCGDENGLVYQEGCLICKNCGHSKCGN
jgi:ribonucleoside-diphosphate reductase alpha chain